MSESPFEWGWNDFNLTRGFSTRNAAGQLRPIRYFSLAGQGRREAIKSIPCHYCIFNRSLIYSWKSSRMT